MNLEIIYTNDSTEMCYRELQLKISYEIAYFKFDFDVISVAAEN